MVLRFSLYLLVCAAVALATPALLAQAASTPVKFTEQKQSQCDGPNATNEREYYVVTLDGFKSMIQDAVRPGLRLRKMLDETIEQGYAATDACAWQRLAQIFVSLSALLDQAKPHDLNAPESVKVNPSQLSMIALQAAGLLDPSGLLKNKR